MTPFAFSCLITASISLFFGTFVYLKKRKFLLGKLWGAVSFMVALWSMGLFGVITSHQENTAMVWQDILDISAIFIPVTFLHFVVCFLNCSRRIKRRMYFFYGAAIFLAIFSFSHWYKLGLVRMKGFNFWIEPGPLYFIFPLYFLGVTGYALYLLASSYFHSEGFKKTQIKYTFIASIIGFGGGATNFLPQLINVYPIGNYIVSFYVLVIFYIIIHYQFLNLKIIATEILITIASIALLVDIFLSRSLILALVKAAIFLAFIYLGQLSIKSVWREIKRRKQLEKLTAELKRSLLNEESQRQEIERLAKELRRSNASLQILNRTLEEKVKQRTRELEKAKQSLEIKVKERTKELQVLTQSLEQKVQERTKELSQKAKELERWYNLTVGRELKMIELKKKIAELEKKS